MKQAFEQWEDLSRDEKKWFEYESRRKAILDEIAMVQEAEIRQEKAREEGLVEGEYQKALEIAKKMLAKKKDLAEIVEFTELTIAEMEQVKQQLSKS